MSDPFADLPKNHFAAIYADPPWHFKVYSLAGKSKARHPSQHYNTMSESDIAALPVSTVAAPDCVLCMWFCWPMLEHAMRVIDAWGFTYKTSAFCWIKANGSQVDLFSNEIEPDKLLGYWTRSNSEACLLATRGSPKRVSANVRQAIIEPRRQHSRKPDCVYERIERLVAGPYLELFARSTRPGWSSWGNQIDKFGEVNYPPAG
jgi:N6-adenosine-specific RNA methylase IME4